METAGGDWSLVALGDEGSPTLLRLPSEGESESAPSTPGSLADQLMEQAEGAQGRGLDVGSAFQPPTTGGGVSAPAPPLAPAPQPAETGAPGVIAPHAAADAAASAARPVTLPVAASTAAPAVASTPALEAHSLPSVGYCGSGTAEPQPARAAKADAAAVAPAAGAAPQVLPRPAAASRPPAALAAARAAQLRQSKVKWYKEGGPVSYPAILACGIGFYFGVCFLVYSLARSKPVQRAAAEQLLHASCGGDAIWSGGQWQWAAADPISASRHTSSPAPDLGDAQKQAASCGGMVMRMQPPPAELARLRSIVFEGLGKTCFNAEECVRAALEEGAAAAAAKMQPDATTAPGDGGAQAQLSGATDLAPQLAAAVKAAVTDGLAAQAAGQAAELTASKGLAAALAAEKAGLAAELAAAKDVAAGLAAELAAAKQLGAAQTAQAAELADANKALVAELAAAKLFAARCEDEEQAAPPGSPQTVPTAGCEVAGGVSSSQVAAAWAAGEAAATVAAANGRTSAGGAGEESSMQHPAPSAAAEATDSCSLGSGGSGPSNPATPSKQPLLKSLKHLADKAVAAQLARMERAVQGFPPEGTLQGMAYAELDRRVRQVTARLDALQGRQAASGKAPETYWMGQVDSSLAALEQRLAAMEAALDDAQQHLRQQDAALKPLLQAGTTRGEHGGNTKGAKGERKGKENGAGGGDNRGEKRGGGGGGGGRGKAGRGK